MLKWIGEGVITFKGIDYGYHDDLPEDLPEATLEHHTKIGNIGKIVETVKLEPKDKGKKAKDDEAKT